MVYSPFVNAPSTPGLSGVLISQISRAWVNIDGTLAGTITPRANFNISSVTKNATGDYTVNFTSALPASTYATVVSASGDFVGTGPLIANLNRIAATGAEQAPTVTSQRITMTTVGQVATDAKYINLIVFS